MLYKGKMSSSTPDKVQFVTVLTSSANSESRLIQNFSQNHTKTL